MAALLRLLPLLPLCVSGIRIDDALMKAGLQEAEAELPITAEDMAASNAEEEPPSADPSADEECNAAITHGQKRNSGWRRWSKKCKCPRNTAMICPGAQDCMKLGRYYSAKKYAGSGCTCGFCAEDCESIVEGSMKRNSAWRRKSAKCKCEKGSVIQGKTLADKENCEANRREERYFVREDMRFKNCHCVTNGTVIPAPAPSPTEAPTPALTPTEAPTPATNETEVPPAPTPDVGERKPNGASRSGGLLLASFATVAAVSVSFA